MLAGWIVGAFALGLLARQVGLPPLVGFLLAGFVFSAFGIERTPMLSELAEAGVLLLLFAVGLKLRLKNLLRAEVWGTALAHLVLTAGVTGFVIHAVSGLGWNVSFMLAIAFGFSSTVMAAKVLETRRELRAFHGRIAIGILIVQDLVAVAFLATINVQPPSPYAVLLLLLPFARPWISRVLNFVGHGELLMLYGAVLALAAGGFGFESLGMSPELGALLLGTMLSDHKRAQELTDALWSLREFFLIGFFLSIGLGGSPSREMLGVAFVLVLLIPIKSAIFFAFLLCFGLRARTAFLTGLSLASYSEFGLIVAQVAVTNELLANQWLVLAALTVALSFALAAPLNSFSHVLYGRIGRWLEPLERSRRHPDDEPITFGSAEVLIVGMGRVGAGAYDHLRNLGAHVVGVDSDPGKVERHLREGRRVAYADAEDPSFWHLLDLERLRAIMLVTPDVEPKIVASTQLRQRGFRGLLSATHLYPEEREPILKSGCDVTYNYFTEAGVGFATHTWDVLHRKQDDG